MRVLQGRSDSADAALAVDAAAQGWGDAVPEVVLAFASTKQDPHAVGSRLAERFPRSLVVGCTTTGEHLGGDHLNGSLVLTGLCDTGIRWASATVRGLRAFDEARAREVTDALFRDLEVNPEDFEPTEYFCLLFIDGLRGAEETFSSLLAEALEGVKLVGGSAGDDLAFRQTFVFSGGRASTDGAVLLMGAAPGRFEVFKHQHFTTTPRRLVVTNVDVEARRVYELNGRRALDAYAAALGVAPAEVSNDLTFSNPVTFSCRGEIYVRSIQRIEPDGSIVFYCAVEEGMVLEVGGHRPITEALENDLAGLTARGPFDFMLGFNCILRALEADKQGQAVGLGALWRRASRASIGFDTYGEQFDGLHINQTLVGLGLRAAAGER